MVLPFYPRNFSQTQTDGLEILNKFLSKHLQNDGHHFGSLAIKFRGCVQLKNKNLPGADSQQTHGLGFPGV